MERESPKLEHPVVVFVVEGDWYALPLHAVERVVPMVAIAALHGAPEPVLGVINLHGQVVPAYDIRRRSGLEPREYGPEALLLVARVERSLVALAAGEVIGVRYIDQDVIAGGDEVVPGVRVVRGIAAIEDRILVIGDLDAFLSSEEELALERALEELRG